MRFECYDLSYVAPRAWAGWWCRHDGRRWRETRVVVPELSGLPRTALIRVEGHRWVHP